MTVKLERPIVLAVGGFDPSGGAGVLADIKTFEQGGVYGFAACTAMTFQNDTEFAGLDWLPADTLIAQLDPLLGRFPVECVKIGIIENLTTLERVIDFIRAHRPTARIVWDPIVSASAGYAFHVAWDPAEAQRIGGRCTLVTPNMSEMMALVPGMEPRDGAAMLGSHCAVLLKGGHAPGEVVVDTLCIGSERFEYRTPRLPGTLGVSGKHGSGCVLAAAITAALAWGEDLPSACEHGRVYAQRFLRSGEHRLGFHAPCSGTLSETIRGVRETGGRGV